jgi:hypothetical protein
MVPPGNILTRFYDPMEDEDRWGVLHADEAVCEANLAADKAAKEAKAKAEADWRAFCARFEGLEYPLAWQDPLGEEGVEIPYDTRNVHGSGWVVAITATDVWLIKNNGMDGDCWAYNNVRTGGAGGIGRCLPRTDELVEAARALTQE